ECQYITLHLVIYFFFSSRRRHTRCYRDWSSDVCSSDLSPAKTPAVRRANGRRWTSGWWAGRSPLHSMGKRLSKRRKSTASPLWRSEERRVGKECRRRGGREC